MLSKWREWAVHRFGIKPIRENTLERRVPRTPWYYGDGATLMLLLVVLIVTGGIMSLTYTPSTDHAHESVRYLTEEQTLGWFVRGLHYWSAGLMVVMLFIHLFRVILTAGYKSPREGTWLIGVALFFLVLLMSFSGYLLRWDDRAIHGLKVALHVLYYVPWIGADLVVIVQGGPEIGARTLPRIYGVHVVLVPMLLLAGVAYHLYLVMLRGTSFPAEQDQPIESVDQQKQLYEQTAQSARTGEPFHPYTSFRSGLMGLIVFGIAAVLAWWRGPHLWEEANLVDPSIPSEEWWFWWASGMAALLPPWIAPWVYVLLPIIALIVLLALPFIDRSPWRGMRRRPMIVLAVLIVAGSLLYLTDLRRRSPWTAWPTDTPPTVPPGLILTPEAEQGRHLFATYGCTSCHAIAGAGRQFATDLARLEDRYSAEALRQYILRPPPGVAMPAYEGRITPEDLDRIAQFVLAIQTVERAHPTRWPEVDPSPDISTPPQQQEVEQ